MNKRGWIGTYILFAILLILIVALVFGLVQLLGANSKKGTVVSQNSNPDASAIKNNSIVVNSVNNTQVIENITYINKTIENIIYVNKTVDNITYTNTTVTNLIYVNQTVMQTIYVNQTINNTNYAENIQLQASYIPEIMSGVYNQYPNFNSSLLEFNVTNTGDTGLTLTFFSEIQGYTSQLVNNVYIGPYENEIIDQHPLLLPSVSLDEITDANIHYKVSLGDSVIDELSIPIKLYAKDTMVWGTTEPGHENDYTSWIAAWVTPHIPEMDSLLRQAADYHPDESIDGYQCSDCQNYDDWQNYTGLQIKAIYNALKNNYSITYVNTPIAYGSAGDNLQRVKLPQESISSESANCIDGTVLFASAMESVGINPYIILIPGHAFVCWDVSDDGNMGIDCLDTTMVHNYQYEDAETEGVNEYLDEYNNGDFDNNLSIAIPINWARSIGITPMS